MSLRRLQFRHGGLVSTKDAAKYGAGLIVVLSLFGRVIIFVIVALASYFVLIEYTSTHERVHETIHFYQLERKLCRGVLRLDDCLYFVASKLKVMWTRMVSFQKSTLDYSFTLSIAESISPTEVEGVALSTPNLSSCNPDQKCLSIELDNDKLAINESMKHSMEKYKKNGMEKGMEYSNVVESLDIHEKREHTSDCAKHEEVEVISSTTLEQPTVRGTNLPINEDVKHVADEDLDIHEEHARSVSQERTSDYAVREEVEAISSTTFLQPTVRDDSLRFNDDVKSVVGNSLEIHEKHERNSDRIVVYISPSPQPQERQRRCKNEIRVGKVSRSVPRVIVQPRQTKLPPSQNVQRMLEETKQMMREANRLLSATKAANEEFQSSWTLVK